MTACASEEEEKKIGKVPIKSSFHKSYHCCYHGEFVAALGTNSTSRLV